VFDARRQLGNIGKELIKAIDKVMSGGRFILGENVLEFEEKFASYLGVKYAVGVASGTDALSLSLTAAGVSSGDEVIMPANSYPTAFSVTTIGAIPKLVDVNPETFNIDPDKIEKAISGKTKAIIAVHLYGQAADLNKIAPHALKHGLKIIEDCAQAHGAQIRFGHNGWRRTGTVGDAGCYSFYPTKNLSCLGDGGMVVTNNTDIYRKVRLLRMYGEEKRYKSTVLGRNSRLDELQAAVLLVKLKYLNRWNERRREIASLYKVKIQNAKLNKRIVVPGEAEYARHVYHLYAVRSKKRDKLKSYLERKGIGTGIHYPKPIHLQPSFKYLGYKKGDFPESERACLEELSLPCFPELTDGEVEYVCSEINKFFPEGKSND